MPSMAMLNAGESRLSNVLIESAENVSRSAGRSVLGISPTTPTGSLSSLTSTVARMIPISEEGTTAFHFFGNAIIKRMTNTPMQSAAKFG
ncbi:hypothetical protein SDC9_128312 [bioreactor metagenome]|uniref:Uncharacterized protein n=1 Tax=bioreactor metagenome TaxID=1076179 RepID=A0A645CVS7_9ZZZZ